VSVTLSSTLSIANGTSRTFPAIYWPRSVVKRDICYQNVCPSLSGRHTRESRLNRSRYRNMLHILRQNDVSRLLRLNIAILTLGVHSRTSALKTGTFLSTPKIWPVIVISWRRCEIECKLFWFTYRKLPTGFDWYESGDLEWHWTAYTVMAVILRFHRIRQLWGRLRQSDCS